MGTVGASRTPVVALLVGALTLTGCSYDGLNDLPLPGTQGRGDGSYSVRIELERASNVLENSQVRVDDVNVGTVTEVAAADSFAVVTVSLNREVRLPANATASVAQTSLLGAKHIELHRPPGEAPVGKLGEGDTIGIRRTAAFPETEDVLAAVSLLLNGGGLAQIETITAELNRALQGREGELKRLLRELNTLAGGLDAQKGDIVAALDGLDRLSSRVAKQDELLDRAVVDLAAGLEVVNRQRPSLTRTIDALGRLGTVGARVVRRSRENLLTNLRHLVPLLRALADSGRSLADSLGLVATMVFPLRTVRDIAVGDYANLFVTLDLTQSTLAKNWAFGPQGVVPASPPGANGSAGFGPDRRAPHPPTPTRATGPVTPPSAADDRRPPRSGPEGTPSDDGNDPLGRLLGGGA